MTPPSTELRELAERLLFGASLADKLFVPERLSDRSPGAAVAVPSAPGRPVELRAVSGRAGTMPPFPRTSELDRDDRRGVALHFFANHELLALELMALALLRFPDAHGAFRRGLAATIADEQRHLSLYLDRMGSLGVELGEIPVNRFFWDTLSGVSDPLGFVAGLSLAFEQANLDHAAWYRSRFAELGDTASAAVMERVLADEVGHVKLGLRWLRAWKAPGQDDWDAWTAALPPPLVPTRGKGREYRADLRQDVGFDARWIAEMAAAGQSKGRPPRVWLFNPTCEAEIARGAPGFSPPSAVAAMAEDLALLPVWLAAPEDAVLVPRLPSLEWRQALVDAGVALPELIEVPDWPRGTALSGRTIGGLEPWGWSPEMCHRLARLGAPTWDPGRREWHSKATAVAAARGLLEELRLDWLVPIAGQFGGEAEALAAPVPSVVKAPLGSAGQDAVRILGPWTSQQRGWLARVLDTQGGVVIERWYDRVADLSWHFDLRDGASRFKGAVHFETDRRGQYRAAWVGRFGAALPGPVLRLLHGDGHDLDAVIDAVGRAVASAISGYEGPVGVDAFVFRDGDVLRLHPLVEINPRWTMGRVALAVGRHLPPGPARRWALVRGEPPAGSLLTTEPVHAGGLVAVLVP